MYLSPAQLKGYNDGYPKPIHQKLKSDIFSIGMLGLEMAELN